MTTEEVRGDRGRMVRARLAGESVGCGASRRIEPTVGEVERMFADPTARGHKIGAALLDQLELVAARLGMTELELETGPRQVEANGLYQRLGDERCAAWGEYLDSATTSMCYRKTVLAMPPI